MTPEPIKLAYSPKEAWRAIGVGKTTFWSLVKAGEIPIFPISQKGRIVRADDLQAYIDRHTGRAP